MNKWLYCFPIVLILSGCFSDNSAQLNDLYDDGNIKSETLIEGAERVEFFYKQQQGGGLVSSIGRITKVLDNQTAPYPAQVILIRLSSGRKLLIKHDIEKGEPVPNIAIGEAITFSGTYRWNNKGGMIISTHQNADQPDRSGWLKYQDVTYQ